jgi:hypothetical protein
LLSLFFSLSPSPSLLLSSTLSPSPSLLHPPDGELLHIEASSEAGVVPYHTAITMKPPIPPHPTANAIPVPHIRRGGHRGALFPDRTSPILTTVAAQVDLRLEHHLQTKPMRVVNSAPQFLVAGGDELVVPFDTTAVAHAAGAREGANVRRVVQRLVLRGGGGGRVAEWRGKRIGRRVVDG